MFFLLGIFYCMIVSFMFATSFFFLFLTSKLLVLLLENLLPQKWKENINVIAFIMTLIALVLVACIVF